MTDLPKYPLRMTWTETGEVEFYEDEQDLLCNLEDFDSSRDDHEARAFDADGRPVWLRVQIWNNVCDVRLRTP